MWVIPPMELVWKKTAEADAQAEVQSLIDQMARPAKLASALRKINQQAELVWNEKNRFLKTPQLVESSLLTPLAKMIVVEENCALK